MLQSAELLDALPMQGDVQALAFLFLADAQADGHVDGFQDEETGHEESYP